MLRVYVHGVGTKDRGSQYKREVLHLVENDVSLCGCKTPQRHWWYITYGKLNWFAGEMSDNVCKHCAQVFAKRQKHPIDNA
jgi:hypothetical protein